MGVSGPVGLAQLFYESVPEALLHRHRGPQGPSAAQVMKLLRQTIFGDVEPALKSAQASAPVVGNQNAFQPVNSSSLVALAIQGVPTLIQCDHVGNPEMASTDLPIVAIGRGRTWPIHFLRSLGMSSGLRSLRQSRMESSRLFGPCCMYCRWNPGWDCQNQLRLGISVRRMAVQWPSSSHKTSWVNTGSTLRKPSFTWGNSLSMPLLLR